MAREEAKRILWPALEDFNEMCALGLQFKQNTGEVVLPNGSTILLQGAGSRREIEKGRGKKYPIVVIDEAQIFTHSLFSYMINEVYEPATIDYLGDIVVTGTPNAACAGPFFDLCHGIQPGWDVHSWTIKDNPHQPQPIEEELDRIRTRRGWEKNHPGYLREYEGKWIRDENDLVFQYKPSLNGITRSAFQEMARTDPEGVYVLGVDVGFNEPMSFTVGWYSSRFGKTVAVRSYKKEGLTPSNGAIHIEKLMREFDIFKIVVDSQGAGKGYAEEWKEKYNLPVEDADKNKKATYVEFLNGDLRSGAAMIVEEDCKPLIDEIQILQWDPLKRERGVFDFQKGFEDHCADGWLYQWRFCRHQDLDNDHEVYVPKQGTKEWYDQEEKHVMDAILNPSESKDWWEVL